MFTSGSRWRGEHAREGVRALKRWMPLSRFAWVFALSGVLNVLLLSTSLYLLYLYDRVLPERSLWALAVLTALVLGSAAAFAYLDLIRGRLLCRAGLAFVDGLDRRALARACAGRRGLALVALADVERVERFLTRAGPAAFFDLLWLPACLALVFFLHPVLGGFAALGVGLLVGVSVWGDRRARDAEARAVCKAAALSVGLAAGSFQKGLRLMLQTGGLGLGALLVLGEQMSAGGLVAAALLLGRTFSALDGALLHRRGLIDAWGSYLRLKARANAAHRATF